MTILLTKGNPKTLKGEKQGFLTYILHLAPHDLSGHNVCPMATKGCIASCLNTAGRGGIFKKGETTNVIQECRIRRTKYFFNDRENFMLDLAKEINKALIHASKQNLTAVFRLNGTSDIAWEKIRVGTVRNIFELFPLVQFYDYTKIVNRKNLPSNYQVTFSKADGNDRDVAIAEFNGMNIAVVFATKELPETYHGLTVFNGDESDLRFLDPHQVIVGLYAKGRARKDYSGFVVR